MGELNLTSEGTGVSTKIDIQSEDQSSEQGGTTNRDSSEKNFVCTTSRWYSTALELVDQF